MTKSCHAARSATPRFAETRAGSEHQDATRRPRSGFHHVLLLATVAIVAAAAVLPARAQEGQIEWRYVGGEQSHSKYSPADEITRDNVDGLQVVWEWQVGEEPLPEYNARPGGFEGTPIMVDNVLYVSTMYTRVVAIDPETGEELWVFDPKLPQREPRHGYKHRGIAFWRDGSDFRIMLNSKDRLYAIDALTGEGIPSFGENGSVSLLDGHSRPVAPETFDQTSPPVVYDDLVIVGSRVPDHLQRRFDTPGSVQAYDVRTGERRWVFHTIPQSNDAFGADTWEDQSWRYTGHANVWGLMSLDEERGLLYVPTSTPSSDYWGGRRLGANLFAESLLCLDARTGERVWHFQAVHHGLWDFDFTSPPNLVTVTVDGRTIDAVAEVSKQGFTYVFDRVTGEPVWPIEERPVDTTTDVPGEVPWPTQPFPTKPPAFAQQGVFLEDANDLTPEIHALALEELSQFRIGPLFTPPSLRGTVQRPSIGGGANWGGASFDPETGMLYVRTSESTTTNQVCAAPEEDAFLDVAYSNNCLHGAAAMIFRGRPGATEAAPRRKLGPIPVIKPPYSHLVAIDLNAGEIAWKVVFGEGSGVMRNHPLLRGVDLPERLGTPGSPGSMVTKGGLLFIGGGDPYLYAFDKATGDEVWRAPTPNRTSGNPMTYTGQSGRQYIVIATGAGPDASLVAFARPR